VTGLSGRKILVALIEGESDPVRLAELGSAWLKASKDELRAALHGFVREHHRFMLRLHLDQVNALDGAIQELETRTEKCLDPFRSVVEHLDTIPWVSEVTAAVIVAEIGVDMSSFPGDEDLVSWAGLCPGKNESAGKHRSRKLKKGAQWLKTTLVQAAWAAVKKKDSYLHAKFLRIKRRQGSKRAIVAIAASMLTAAYYRIQRNEDFSDLGGGPLRSVRSRQVGATPRSPAPGTRPRGCRSAASRVMGFHFTSGVAELPEVARLVRRSHEP
jgi:transposase